MWLKCSEIKSPNGKVYKNYKIVESVREHGKIKHKILFSLGALTDEKAEQIRQVLMVSSSPNEALIRLDDVIVEENIDFLDIYTFRLLWKEWAMDSLFHGFPFIERLVINRCLKPKSKIGAVRWNHGCVLDYFDENKTLPKNKFGVYTELDDIYDMEEDIQRHIMKKLQEQSLDSLQAVVYDITSTFFEDTQCTIAMRGYSRDGRPDKLQIVIALAITPKGYPFYWKVYEGNTQDITTMKTFVDDVKNRFGIEKCLLVFDRGMVSKENIGYMDEEGFEYITAIDKNEIEGLGIEGLDIFSDINRGNVDERLKGYSIYDGDLRYKEFSLAQKRYIIGFSVARKEEEEKSRAEKIRKFLGDIDEINQDLMNARRSRNIDKTKARVYGLIKKYKLTRLANAQYRQVILYRGKNEVNTYKVDVRVDEAELQKAGMLDGVTCFYTNISPDGIMAAQVIRHYRDKNKVEEAFHEIKGHIRLRPVFVSRDKRVCAHVTICMLAYLLLNTLEERLDRKEMGMTLDEVLEELGHCKINILGTKSGKMRRAAITKMSDIQVSILRNLGYDKVDKLKEVKDIIKKLSIV